MPFDPCPFAISSKLQLHFIFVDRRKLAHGIFLANGPLPEEKQAALREWLALLAQSLPPEMERTHLLVEQLQDEFDQVVGGQARLDEAVRVSVSPRDAWLWRTCTYGDNDVGYTCGLWQLFHVLAAGVVERTRREAPLPMRRVAETLRNCE